MNKAEIRNRIDHLNVWKRGGIRAPHKPLLLLIKSPFWHLQSDGLWDLDQSGQLEKRKSGSSAKKSELFKYNVSGGLALCALHHKLFDRGAFTISDKTKVIVSETAHGTHGMDEWLLAFHGKDIRPPQRPSYYPEPKFVNWHVKEVFKGLERAS